MDVDGMFGDMLVDLETWRVRYPPRRYAPATVQPSERAASACRRSNVTNVRWSASARSAAARWSASSVLTPVSSAISAPRAHVLSSRSTTSTVIQSVAKVSRSARSRDSGNARWSARRTSTTVCAAEIHAGSDVSSFPGLVAFGLAQVELDQSACIDVERHSSSRSSRMISMLGRFGLCLGLVSVRRFPLPGRIQPSRIPRSTAVSVAGPSVAFGLPRSVTRMTSPFAARSR